MIRPVIPALPVNKTLLTRMVNREEGIIANPIKFAAPIVYYLTSIHMNVGYPNKPSLKNHKDEMCSQSKPGVEECSKDYDN